MCGFIPVSSKDNQYLKQARALGLRKERAKTGLFLVEGVRLGEEAVAASALSYGFISCSATTDARAYRLACRALQQGVTVYEISDELMKSISDTEHSQGIVFVSRIQSVNEAVFHRPGFYLFLDGIADPGNMGTIIRTGYAVGAGGIILGPGCVDLYNPKTVRAAMGALFRLPHLVFRSQEDAYRFVCERGWTVLVAAAGGANVYDSGRLRDDLLWVMGSEAQGVSAFWRERATEILSLPMRSDAESLNVAAATAAVLYCTAASRNFDTL